MKSIFLNLKNFLPYLIIIIIYFFFVNIEARKEQNNINRKVIEKLDSTPKNSNKTEEKNGTIRIQVIPYSF